MKALKTPVLIIAGDADVATLEHSVAMFRLLGGGAMGDMGKPLPASRLAVLPATSHTAVITPARSAARLHRAVPEGRDAEGLVRVVRAGGFPDPGDCVSCHRVRLVRQTARRNPMPDLSHYVDGAPAAGRSGRFADVFNPATGAAEKRVPLARGRRGRAASSPPPGPPCRPGRRPRRCAARASYRSSSCCMENADTARRADLRRARQDPADALGEVTRGLEVVEFACGIPHLLKGEFTENVGTDVDSHSLRQPLGVVAGITPVQLPGDGADVDVPGGARLRQLLRAEAVGARSRRRRCCSPSC